MHTTLGGSQPSTQIDARLTELAMTIDSEDAAGRPAPIRVRNPGPVVFGYDRAMVRLSEPAVFVGPVGEFTLTGRAGKSELGVGTRFRVWLPAAREDG